MFDYYFIKPTLGKIAKEIRLLGKKARYLLKETQLEVKKFRAIKDPINYETELIQVAASAIAALTDRRMGMDTRRTQTEVETEIFKQILKERRRQDELFGHSMPIAQDPCIWGAVLVEEVSEVFDELS